MNKKYFILIPLFIIWIGTCGYMIYQGQFLSLNQVENAQILSVSNHYPTLGVFQACFIYSIWMVSYVFLFCSRYAVKHPFVSYTFCSILPILLPALSFIWATDVPPYIAALIIVCWTTSLFHFLLLPFLLPIYRKYIYPQQ